MKVMILTINDINKNAYELLQRGELGKGIAYRHQQETPMKSSLEFTISDQK